MSAALLGLAIALTLLHAAIGLLNLQHLRHHGHHIPPGFEEALDADVLKKISAYNADRSLFAQYANLASRALLFFALFGGAMEFLDRWTAQLTQSFVIQGVLYCLIASFAATLVTLPFDAYSRFVIEERHGFNRCTASLYWTDLAKSFVLTAVLVSIVTACGLALVQWSHRAWWVCFWAILLVFELLITLLAPRLIEPLFMKVVPLQDPSLSEDIQAMAARAGVRVDRTYQVDASRRSGHTNAYFTGMGPVKRVILYDTLLERLKRAEVLAVLAHELGHWKLRHVLKSFILMQGLTLAACYAAHRMINWARLPEIVGTSDASFLVRATISVFVLWLLATLITPGLNAWSRRHEWQADRYACALVEPGQLASGLVKLSKDNLANLHPHGLYTAFYGTHPPMVARVNVLMAQQESSIDFGGGHR
jgi:STE24 endopeptidase